MKLRNKKTGEILETTRCSGVINDKFRIYDKSSNKFYIYHSLAALNEEWEDYEEPKVYWFISDRYKVFHTEDTSFIDKERKSLGNYFETREEAEKAVEKLKAWKRLKDKGFEIEGWTNHIGDNYYKTGQIVLNLNNVKNREWNEFSQIMEIKDDLYLLFGGEE